MSFFAKDLNEKLVYVNQSLVDHFGLGDRENIINKSDYDLHPHYMAEKFERDDRSILKSKKPLNNLIEPFPDKFGVPQWYITNKAPIKAE
ncbi:MAG: PAS domain-containing protein [Verrucomicrobia bacterium]|nr:PAS domain-containing protein [Verrucomicrobiota bacterium]